MRQTQKKKILLLHTGGTIGMGISDPPFANQPLSPDTSFVKSLFKSVPELQKLALLDVIALCNKDSSQLTPKDWVAIATKILKLQDSYDGFVVTHGTDTMAYTATAVSFLLPYPCKPVVFTGSQRPLQEIRTDARRNLICSVSYAAAQKVLETMVFFDTVLLRGNRTVKVHIEDFHTFESPNFPHLAEEKLQTQYARLPRESLMRPSFGPHFSGRVQVVRVYPGVQVTLATQAQCVLIEAFGCGNLPLDDSSVLKLLKQCARKKIPVIMTSQVRAGVLRPEIYEMSRRALELGVIPAGDMTFEAALVKAMILAGNRFDYADWPEAMLCNWAGEMTVEKPT